MNLGSRAINTGLGAAIGCLTMLFCLVLYSFGLSLIGFMMEPVGYKSASVAIAIQRVQENWIFSALMGAGAGAFFGWSDHLSVFDFVRSIIIVYVSLVLLFIFFELFGTRWGVLPGTFVCLLAYNLVFPLSKKFGSLLGALFAGGIGYVENSGIALSLLLAVIGAGIGAWATAVGARIRENWDIKPAQTRSP